MDSTGLARPKASRRQMMNVVQFLWVPLCLLRVFINYRPRKRTILLQT
jgi:hypothetical protein